MAKKQPPPFTLSPEIDLPEDPVPIPESLERKLEEKWVGLFTIKVYANANEEGNATIGTIDIPSVIGHDVEPPCSRDTIAAYVMTYINTYTAKLGRKVKYRIRLHQRGEGDKRYGQWNIDFAQSPPPEVLAAREVTTSQSEEVAVERERSATTFLGGATDAVSVALDKVNTIVSQAMKLLELAESRTDRQAERADRTAERYEHLVSTIVQDRENHSKIAQTGFDALHHGVEMQGASMQQKWEYEMQIRDLRAEIEKSRNSGQGGMTQSLIQMMTPLLTMAGTQFLTKMGALPPGSDKDVMHAIASQMVPGGGHAGGGSHDETPPPAPPPTGSPRPAAEAPTPPQPSRGLPTVMDISTEEDRAERPFTVLLKLFHESFTFKDQQAATSTLRAEEWKLLWDCNDNQDQAMIVALITRFITVVGPTRANAFMSAITPRTRAIFGEILMQCKRYAEKEPFVWSPCTMDASIVSVETKPEMKPAATCPKCTAMWPPELRFCGRCGASMSTEEAKTEAKTEAKVEVHVEPEPADEQEISRKEISKKKGKKQRAAHAGSVPRNVTRDG